MLSRAYKATAQEVVKELGIGTTFEPVYPECSVQKRFFDTHKEFEYERAFAYHGTKEKNIDSISKVGLLKPGKNGHQVANGSVHGVGIYTARLGAARLSRGFCDSLCFFLCAICDTNQLPSASGTPTDPVSTADPWKPSMTHVQTQFPPRAVPGSRTLSGHKLHRESNEVRHVGDAIVIFKEECVVPVFKVSMPDPSLNHEATHVDTTEEPIKVPELKFPIQFTKISMLDRPLDCRWKHHAQVPEEESCWELPKQVGRRRLVLPIEGETLVRPDRCNVVWVTKDPWEHASRQALRLKRNMLQRERQEHRRIKGLREDMGNVGLWF
jgi:hypothetical protein